MAPCKILHSDGFQSTLRLLLTIYLTVIYGGHESRSRVEILLFFMIKLTVRLTESRFFIDTMMCTDDTRIKDVLMERS